MDSIIDAKEFQIERKRFHVEFRENDRGKFLRINVLLPEVEHLQCARNGVAVAK